MKDLLPPSIAPPFARYSHGVRFDPKDFDVVVTSGQLGLGADGVTPDGAEAQAEICFANNDAILREAGGSMADVVKISAYVTDRAHMAGYMAARDRWMASARILPASTLMIVSGFTRPEFVVEVEVMACIPKAR